ncbi:MBL fold metallo-hydrolase [Corynebacterium alimapuense]|uniref:Hydrolase n=1 Tax=Corynebacterium alimapuense TaxID=1576874 RepID=A0A3M8K9P2_9CORY|nr:MBL fold metallo-hydrolase [Corynebacterium alimapuense]RNE49252.1 hydrolase [Corynebacterium alimapuense]
MNLLGFAAGPYQTNCYLLINEGSAVVIDPGMHADEKISELLAEQEATVEAIVLTHGHIDHTRDAGTLARRLGVPVYIHPDDAFMLVAGEGVSPQSQVLFDAASMTQVDDLRELADGQSLQLAGVDTLIRHAPGHSPGCVLIIAEEFAFTGDVLFQGSIGRTDLPHSDLAAMNASLRGPVWEMADTLQLLPGHGPVTSMRAERNSNPFLRDLG